MIEITIPGQETIIIKHLVCDVNGTLALDGKLLPGVEEKIKSLKNKLEIHLVTANTHGNQDEINAVLELQATVLSAGHEAEQKAAFVRNLDAKTTAVIGQGANDQLMMGEAGLGICVLSREGTYGPTLQAADIIVPDILSALDLFDHPTRLAATLRR